MGAKPRSYDKGSLRRSCRAYGGVSSDEDPLPEEERATDVPAPANIPSQEERLLLEAQLQREGHSPEENLSIVSRI